MKDLQADRERVVLRTEGIVNVRQSSVHRSERWRQRGPEVIVCSWFKLRFLAVSLL